MTLCGERFHLSALLLMGQRRVHCHVAIDYPHIGWWGGTRMEKTHEIRRGR